MKNRILGIDLGTNSLGWAIVDYDTEATEGEKYTSIEHGVNIFQEGVKIEKGIESSRASERTGYRHQRIGYWRRKLRKIALLKVLQDNQLCPTLSKDELHKWRNYKIYPTENQEFMEWQRTSEQGKANPYFYRKLCLTQKLDLNNVTHRYILGRAIYHLNQRRGFLSNRKEETKASDGAVTQGIDAISKQMHDACFEYLGEYFYDLYTKSEKIRNHYTDRLQHYEKELLAICHKQGLDRQLTETLRKIIITQRPLKSQKHSVGKCVFEPKKPRCPQSHPYYEQFRLYSSLNNIKIQTPYDKALRFLTPEEKQEIIPLFMRKSKPQFKFEEIAKRLSGSKNNFCYYRDEQQRAFKFNYHMDTTVSGCPVTAQLGEVFDAKDDSDSWIDAAAEVYTQAAGKTRDQIVDDVWHSLFFFEDAERLKQFAIDKLQLTDDKAELFSKIKLPADYASLSLKAIRKILPYMKERGMIYPHAVFMANIPTVLGLNETNVGSEAMLSEADTDEIIAKMEAYDPEADGAFTRERYIKEFIIEKYNIPFYDRHKLDKLYHPSMIETYPKVTSESEKGCYQLGSPRINSVRNPMAMRALFNLRHLINTLLSRGIIDRYTQINIEFARELNDANRRAAIKAWQRENEAKHQKIAELIKETKGKNYTLTATDILKYELWEEQNHICLYTGDSISFTDLFDSNKFDIEHTIPRSVGGDSTNANLTLCQSKFNRNVKNSKIPSELACHEDIMERISHWKERIDELDKQIRKLSTRGITDKSTKDRIIQKRHRLLLERDYWRSKYERFTMTEVPTGFALRQGINVGVISRYARLYLKSLFTKVEVVKGIATSDFRKIWGLQDEYEKKARVNHCHHAIDALTVACIGRNEYDRLAKYYHDEERHHWGLDARRAAFPKPWPTFTEDVKNIEQSIMVYHDNHDNIAKRTRKRVRGTSDEYMQGDTARGSLHNDTIYGAISKDGEIRYVVRRALNSMKDSDVENIVDDTVKSIVRAAIKRHGSLAKAVEHGIMMNEAKGIAINKVRCYAPSVKRPLSIRTHRDLSAKEYKRPYYVTNDTNYMMGIYVGRDAKGRERRVFELINRLDAVRRITGGANKNDLLPTVSKSGYPLKWAFNPGTLVLMYESSPDELYALPQKELVKRLYKVVGLTSMKVDANEYGVINFKHNQEARPGTEIKIKKGAFKSGEEYRPVIGVLHTQFNALIEGRDFTIDRTGRINFMLPEL